jgi:type IV pilus assembly protein PilA
MRLFHSCEATYQSGIGNGSFCSAADLFKQDFIDPVLANASGVPAMSSIGGVICQGDGTAKNGYKFTIKYTKPASNKLSRFKAVGVPIILEGRNRTGNRSFFVDETGVIRFSDDPSIIADANSPPLN